MANAKKKKAEKSKTWLYVSLVFLLIIGFAVFRVFGPNTGNLNKGEDFYLSTGWNYDQMKTALYEGGYIANEWSFDLLANQAKLPEHVHAGKYKIKRGMSNYNLVRMLRSGRQTPVRLVINKLRTKRDFINLISNNLEADAGKLQALLQDPDYLRQFGLDTNTAMCGIMPDTYDFFWNVSADRAFRKLVKNYTRFWDTARRAKAKAKGLTPNEAIIIASVVDEETNMPDDKPKIVSVYLNRVAKGMKLQADPTVKFAIGDFAIKRVTGKMLEYVSPYNTYMYAGLPPGPICTPAVSSIEAVLEAPATTYLYFCAKEDFSGYSSFATTFDDQLKNARAYQKALDARGIH
jgi:UPF0755 protein